MNQTFLDLVHNGVLVKLDWRGISSYFPDLKKKTCHIMNKIVLHE